MKKEETFVHALSAVLISLALTAAAIAQPNTAPVSVPAVTLLPGVPTLDARPLKLAGADQVLEEFVATGSATSYKPVGGFGEDGRWAVQALETAQYTTRFAVIRPAQAEKFNGTVVTEWLNVSGGFDYSPARIMMSRELARSGYVWVDVSAQVVGIQGGPTLTGMSMPLKKLNAERYKELSHPGDAFSFDIYSQIGRLLKEPKASSVLAGLPPKHVISTGESQSALYLTTYINAIDPIAKVFDGFLNYSRFGFAAPLEGIVINAGWLSTLGAAKMRSDLRVPVLIFVTETDVIGVTGKMTSFMGYYTARQPDTERLRTWEIACTSHADSYLHQLGRVDTGSASYEQLAEAYAPTNNMQGMKLEKPCNDAPQHHYAVQAAIAALQKWVSTRISPTKASPIELVIPEIVGAPTSIIQDENGNSKGDVRSPWVEVPTSRLSGRPCPKTRWPCSPASLSRSTRRRWIASIQEEELNT